MLPLKRLLDAGEKLILEIVVGSDSENELLADASHKLRCKRKCKLAIEQAQARKLVVQLPSY